MARGLEPVLPRTPSTISTCLIPPGAGVPVAAQWRMLVRLQGLRVPSLLLVLHMLLTRHGYALCNRVLPRFQLADSSLGQPELISKSLGALD